MNTHLSRVLIATAGLLAITAGLVITPSAGRPVHAQGAACGPMDVAFVIDTTGSMGSAINNVKSELAAILGDISTASGNDYRLALVDFRDDVFIFHNFAANNAGAVGPTILGLGASGGGGEPESSDEALNTVVNALPAAGRPQNIDFTPAFRAGALKIAILVTDARPGGFDDTFTAGVDDTNAHLRALQAAAQGIKLSAIYTETSSFFSPTIEPIMMDYAATTGGVYIKTPSDGSGTGQGIRNIIASCGSGTGPDITVTKELKPGQPRLVPGGYISYLIRVKNVGNQATPPPPVEVTLRDDLSGVGTFTFWWASKGRCTSNAPYVDCNLGRLSPGEEVVIEIRARLRPNACEVVNRAVVDRFNRIVETNEANNSISLLTLVGACEDDQ